ncbi:hypothetical protein ACFLV4_06565, partial [Chloroflexota bacterium]
NAEKEAQRVREAELQAEQEAELFTREKAKREAYEPQRTRQAEELAKQEAEIPKEVRGWNWARWGIGLFVGILVVSVAVIIANWEDGSIPTPMFMALAAVGMLALPIAIVMLIVNAIRKKKLRIWGGNQIFIGM